MLPRGIRNHNPGNIVQNNIKWEGAREQPFDPKFVEFIAPEWGIRAMMRILQSYYHRHGLDTVQAIINRWAPPHENATDHYAQFVAKSIGVKRYDVLNMFDPKIVMALCRAIILFENGQPKECQKQGWYTAKLYQKAYALTQNQMA